MKTTKASPSLCVSNIRISNRYWKSQNYSKF